MPLMFGTGGKLWERYMTLRHREFNGDREAGIEARGIDEAVNELLSPEASGALVMDFDVFQVNVALGLADFLSFTHGRERVTEKEAWDAACSDEAKVS